MMVAEKESRWKSKAGVGVALVVGLIASTTSLAVAVGQFSDLGGTQWADEIYAVADAGCATGNGNGKFLPDSKATRLQFAVWLNRCGGRIAHAANEGTVVPVSGEDNYEIVDVTLDLNAPAGGTQMVNLQGEVVVSSDYTYAEICSGGSDCVIKLSVWDDDLDEAVTPLDYRFVYPGDDIYKWTEVVSINTVVEAGEGAHTYSIRYNDGSDVAAAKINLSYASLTASMFTFGHDGGNSIGG